MGRIYVTEIKLVSIKTRSDNVALPATAYHIERDRVLEILEALDTRKLIKLW